MSRRKTIDDESLLKLIDSYYFENCIDGGKPLKLPEIAAYIAEHGYPDYKVTTLRRNSDARKHIEDLSANSREKSLSVLITYQTLDVQGFIAKHPTYKSMIQGLTELDNYYHRVANSGIEFANEKASLTNEIAELQRKLSTQGKELSALREQVDSLKNKVTELTKTKDNLQRAIDRYIQPAIAQKMMVQEGIVTPSESIISDETLGNNLVTASTNISFLCSTYEPPEGSEEVKPQFEIPELQDMFLDF